MKLIKMRRYISLVLFYFIDRRILNVARILKPIQPIRFAMLHCQSQVREGSDIILLESRVPASVYVPFQVRTRT